MASIPRAFRAFLKETGWRFQKLDARHVRVVIAGEHGEWPFIAGWNESDDLFVAYSICPIRIPEEHRQALTEFITRANYDMPVGNFEMDLSDGEIRFKTSLPDPGRGVTTEQIGNLSRFNCYMLDKYLPGLLSVASGMTTPEAAIAAADQPPPQTNDAAPPPSPNSSAPHPVTNRLRGLLGGSAEN